MEKGKKRKKTFTEQVFSMFSPSKKAEGNTHPREHGNGGSTMFKTPGMIVKEANKKSKGKGR